MKTQADINKAYVEGRYLKRSFNKNITVNTTVGVAQDLSGTSGNPVAQYFLGNAGESTELSYLLGKKGLDHGGTMEGYRKFIHKITLQTVTAALAPCVLNIYDYLMYYPFNEMDTGLQTLNQAAVLPRYDYADGIMMIEQNPYIGNVTCQVGYTNQDGVAGRLTSIFTINTVTAAGTVASSARTTAGVSGQFLPLQSGDYGVKSLESIEFFSGDLGTVSLVLVKNIATTEIKETTAPNIIDFWFNYKYLPEVKNDAYLNFVFCPSAAGTGAVTNTIFGELVTIWELIT